MPATDLVAGAVVFARSPFLERYARTDVGPMGPGTPPPGGWAQKKMDMATIITTRKSTVMMPPARM